METISACLYCERAVKARGLCSGHWARWYHKLPMDPPLRTGKLASCHPNRPHRAKGLCLQCYQTERMRYYRSRDGKAKHAALARQQRKKLKDEFLQEYGGKCSCCGEKERAFLTLEHKRKDGKQHRKKYSTTSQMLADIKRMGWPKDNYEIMCFNCNVGSKLDECPHKKTL